MKNALLSKIYIVFSVFYLSIILLGREDLALFLKPFLIPILILLVYKTENFKTKNILICALIFSWIGDVILIFADKGEIYFIIGLLFFLISHILYIILFSKQILQNNCFKNPIFIFGCILVLIYLASMLTLLFPKLGGLKIPVSVYAITISIMLISVLKGFFSWGNPAKTIILFGAICFVTSDSLLAINKFHSTLTNASFWIMITYLIAQYCIANGILNLNLNKKIN